MGSEATRVSWDPQAPNPCVPPRIQHLCDYYIQWPFSRLCNHGCPYCFTQQKPGVPNPRDWTDAQAMKAWENFYDDHGPAYVLMTGAEPTTELPLMADVLRHHFASVQTNLTFDADAFCAAIPPDRVELHPTFHPLGWHLDIEPFLLRLRTLKARGYTFGLVALVGYPAYIDRVDEYVAQLRAEVGFVNVVPARLTTYRGRQLPNEYTEAELEVLLRYISPDWFDDCAVVRKLDIIACAAGVATACVLPDGTVRRCAQVLTGMGRQNMMHSGRIKFLAEPLPCSEKQCMCGNLYPYHITEDQT